MSRLTRPDLAQLPSYVPGRSTPGAIKLASNEVPFGPLPGVAEAVAEAAAQAHRYPDMGVAALREALAQRYGVEPERIITGCGSVALAEHLAQATCRPGDEILYSWRSFEAYPIIVAGVGAVSVQVPNTPDHGHDLAAMAAAVTDRTRMILVCNPNNPTGTALTRADLDRFLDAVGEDVLVVIDEAYREFVTDPACRTGSRPTATGPTWWCCAPCPRRGAWPACASASWSPRRRSPRRWARSSPPSRPVRSPRRRRWPRCGSRRRCGAVADW